jgi:uncharacterized protein YgiM (DUF1202 family)
MVRLKRRPFQRIAAFFFVFVLLFSAVPYANAAAVQATVKATAELRLGPGDEYEVVGKLSAGTQVTVTEQSNAGWAGVRLSNGKAGYCLAAYLDFSNQEQGSKRYLGTTTDYLRVRSGPGTVFQSYRTLPPKSQVNILDNSQPFWAQVMLSDGVIGYCSKEYLTITEQNAPAVDEHLKDDVMVQERVAVTEAKLSLRSGPGTAYRLLGFLEKNTETTVLDDGNPLWMQVQSKLGVGYCNASLLSVTTRQTGAYTELRQGDYGQAVLTMQKRLAALGYYTAAQNSQFDTVTVSALAEFQKVAGMQENGVATNQVLTKLYAADAPQKPAEQDPEPPAPDPNADYTVPVGKTLYLPGETDWRSSDSSVATVINGYVQGISQGNVKVTSKKNGKTITRLIAVSAAQPVKFAYTSPNIVLIGKEVTLVAITDLERDAVRFTINGKTIDATSKTKDGNTYIWTGSVRMDTAGSFSVQASARKNGKWETCNDAKTNAFVINQSDTQTTTLQQRRASDEVIQFIATCEGFLSEITNDQLASNQAPTIGHGQTFTAAGDQFYNHITRKEAWAMLVQSVNNGPYTSEVNKFITNNAIKCNQQQFDMMVSLSYNIGAYKWNSNVQFDLRDVMLNAYDPNSTASGTTFTGTVVGVDSNSVLNVRSTYSTSGQVLDKLKNGEKVTVLDNAKTYGGSGNIWVRVRTARGVVGYCSTTYLQITQSGGSAQRDLKYINQSAFLQRTLEWHKAGGNNIWGLFTRRIDEAEIFLYGEYVRDGSLNKHGFPVPSYFK